MSWAWAKMMIQEAPRTKMEYQCGMSPKAAINVVEAAGGCKMRVAAMKTPVIPTAVAATRTPVGVKPPLTPKAWDTLKASQPTTPAIRCPSRVFRGEDMAREGA